MRDEVTDTVIHGQAPILIGIQRAIAVGILEPSACYGEHRLDSRTDDRLRYWSLIVARTAGGCQKTHTHDPHDCETGGCGHAQRERTAGGPACPGTESQIGGVHLSPRQGRSS